MKVPPLLFAFLLAIPPMVNWVGAAERSGSGSSRDSGGRGSLSRDASPSRGGERQSHSVQRDASPSRGSSGLQAGRQAQSAPTSREMRTSDRSALSDSRSRADTGTRGTSEAQRPGGMSPGTAFPRSDTRPPAATTRRLDTSRQGDGRNSPVGSDRSEAVRSNRNDPRDHTDRSVGDQRSARVGTARSDNAHGGDDRTDGKADDRIQRHTGSRENQDRLHNSGEGDRPDKARENRDRRASDSHTGSGGGRDGLHDGRKGDRFDRDAGRNSGRYTKRWHTGSRSHWHGDIRHFKRHDFDKWRRGSWHHGHHHGRIGWWWVVGPSWYFYSGPVYPYPNPYVPPVVVVSHTVVDDTDYWYYCEDADDYYPYVEECAGEWIPIPAEPEDTMPPRY